MMIGVLRARQLLRIGQYGLVSVLLAVLLVVPSVAAAGNATIAQDFHSSGAPVTAAAIVGATSASADTVELSTVSTADKLVGVVSGSPLVELSDGANGVKVVTAGLTAALVSDINGTVLAGDKITASPIKGVGMKATENTQVVGTAQSGMDGAGQETRKLKDKSGQERDVRIAKVPVQVAVSYYSAETGKGSLFVPPALQQAANTVSGRDVSPVRLLMASVVLVILFGIIFVVLRTAVSSSITAVGRNPLAGHMVQRSLLQVGVTVVGLLMLGTGLIYLVLRF